MKSQPISRQLLLILPILWFWMVVYWTLSLAGIKALPGMWHSDWQYLLGESIGIATGLIALFIYAQSKSKKNIDSNTKPLSEVFWALSNPIRLEIVQRLLRGELVTVGSLTGDLGISRFDLLRHIYPLAQANVVSVEPNGRNGSIRLVADALVRVREFAAAAD